MELFFPWSWKRRHETTEWWKDFATTNSLIPLPRLIANVVSASRHWMLLLLAIFPGSPFPRPYSAGGTKCPNLDICGAPSIDACPSGGPLALATSAVRLARYNPKVPTNSKVLKVTNMKSHGHGVPGPSAFSQRPGWGENKSQESESASPPRVGLSGLCSRLWPTPMLSSIAFRQQASLPTYRIQTKCSPDRSY